MRNRPRELCLDTTVQVDRLFERPERKRLLQQTLAEAECHTATLVVREFKGGALQACISLYDGLAKEQSEDRLFNAISENFSHRKQSMMLKVWAQVKREIGSTAPFDTELALATLREYITGGLLLRFRGILTRGVVGLLRCRAARAEVQERSGLFELDTWCARQRADCNLPQVCEENERCFRRAQNALRQALGRRERGALKPIAQVYSMKQKRNGWQVVKGRVNCRKLADLTILIESLPRSAVYTTDQGFQHLFDHLGFPGKHRPVVQKYPRER